MQASQPSREVYLKLHCLVQWVDLRLRGRSKLTSENGETAHLAPSPTLPAWQVLGHKAFEARIECFQLQRKPEDCCFVMLDESYIVSRYILHCTGSSAGRISIHQQQSLAIAISAVESNVR